MEAFYELDVVSELGKITMSKSKLLAKSIPNARLVLLDSNRHVLGAHEPAWQELLRELDAFLAS